MLAQSIADGILTGAIISLGAIGVAIEAGLPKDAILQGLANFGGVGRRFERKGEKKEARGERLEKKGL